MKNKFIRLIFLTNFMMWTAGVTLTQGTLRADTIVYAVTYGSGVIGTLDLNTGVFTQIAAPGLPLSSVSGIGEYGGNLYGANIGLYQINASTGAVTSAPLTFNNNGNGFGAGNGFGSTTAGLFAVGGGSGGNYLYSVNPTTGNPTLIGSTGIIAGGGTGELSASNDSTKLYWEIQTNCSDALYSLNTSTGAATLIGTETVCYPSKTGNPTGMVFTGGVLWVNFYTQGFGTINTSNGAQTLVSTSEHPLYAGLAPYPLTSTMPSLGSRFVPITPCRVADTRNPAGPFGGPALTGNASRDFAIPSGACNIPSTATAFSLNAAVVPHASLGFITVWPAGQSQPLVATLNSLDGRIKVNAAIVPAGTNGAISVFASDTTDLILDINGYYVPAADPSGLAFYPVTPCRIADTRNAAGPLGGPLLAGLSDRTFPILQSSCGIPATARAYSLNFAAVPQTILGYLTVWPTGESQPLAASLSAVTGAVTANAVVVAAGTNGSVDVFASNATDVVIDVNGYFAPPGAGGFSLYNLTPCRVLDSRLPAGSPPFGGTRDVNVTGSGCNTPANAEAYVFNATVVPPGVFGFLTLWPQGQIQPLAATLNAVDGALTSNMAIVPTHNGSISAFASSPTHLVLDIFGYFAP